MENLLKFKNINRLKSIYRSCEVAGRKESSAEHTWSCLILADYFLSQSNYDLDKTRAYELIMYHDLVEVEAGDTALHPHRETPNKAKNEMLAAIKLKEIFPDTINEKFLSYFIEFEEQKTIEAKFAKAIDAIDPIIQQIAFETKWKGWSREFMIAKKAAIFKPFPEIEISFNKLLDYLSENEYFEA